MNKKNLEEIWKKINDATNWNALASLENNKLVQRTLIFLFIIPIVAKFLSKLENPVVTQINSYVLKLVISLPFSWVAFYFSALSFTLSMLIFRFFAPKIISDFASLGSHVNEGKIWTNLVIYLQDLEVTDDWLESFGINRSHYTGQMRFINLVDELRRKGFKESKIKVISDRYDLLSSFYDQLIDNSDEPKQEWEKRESSFIKHQFWQIFHYANKTKLFWRILCTVLYLIGFGLIAYVFWQNIIYVIQFYNNDIKL